MRRRPCPNCERLARSNELLIRQNADLTDRAMYMAGMAWNLPPVQPTSQEASIPTPTPDEIPDPDQILI